MKKLLIVSLLILAVVFPAYASDASKESVYDRVMRTGTIRCGYGLWGDYLSKDPNTGKMSGIFYDYMETLGRNLGLKIDWTEETGWGDYIAALRADRFDAYCTLVAWNAERAREADFITPIMYMRADVFVRKDDKRFDNNFEGINNPSVMMVTIEGDIYSKIARDEFPNAKKLQLSQLATEAELFLLLSGKKADVVITENSAGQNFMKSNPNKIRIVTANKPFRSIPSSISIRGGEARFQRMLDIATIEMLNNGSFDKIRKAHPTVDLKPAQTYETK